MQIAGHIIWVVLITVFLSACSDKENDNTVFEAQKYYFIESLTLVERAGRELQDSELTQAKISLALETMDKGLKLAFQVENDFLNSLDARLGKNYQRYFVKGIETYRIGIEAGDKGDQIKGMKLLGLWSVFWSAEQAAINTKLYPT